MKSMVNRAKGFFQKLHQDESAPNTVEWVLLVVVALIVMTAIYYIAKWVLGGGADEAKKVDQGRQDASQKVDEFKKLSK